MHTWFNAFHHFSFSRMFASVFSYFRSAYLNNSLLYIWMRSSLSHLNTYIHVLFAFWCTYFMIKWHWSSSKLCQRKKESFIFHTNERTDNTKWCLFSFMHEHIMVFSLMCGTLNFCVECISWEMSKIIFVCNLTFHTKKNHSNNYTWWPFA